MYEKRWLSFRRCLELRLPNPSYLLSRLLWLKQMEEFLLNRSKRRKLYLIVSCKSSGFTGSISAALSGKLDDPLPGIFQLHSEA